MLTEKETIERDAWEITCAELLAPQEPLLRKIDATVDFSRVYGIVGDLYGGDNGRPSVDMVADIEVNVAYRRFIGYGCSRLIPHFATVSCNFCQRSDSQTVERIFLWILDEINRAGYLSPEIVSIDGTHVKANANLKKQVKKAIPAAAKAYEAQLREEVNQDRGDHGKKPFDGDPPDAPVVEKEITNGGNMYTTNAMIA